MDIQQAKNQVESILVSISKILPGFRPRASQKAMMMKVVEVLANARSDEHAEVTGDNFGCIEAPTGTGKTLGYAIPAWVVAKMLDRKVVVSSATVALQEQFINKDLPIIAKAVNGEFAFAVAKGRGRYACTAKLLRASGSAVQDDMFGDAVWERQPREDEIKILGDLGKNLASSAWDGDRDSLSDPVPDDLWSRVSTDRHGCSGRNCPQICACPYMRAREKFQKADVIVANHDLVLADLRLGGGRLLPDPIKTFYIMDEAHNLPQKAVSTFSGSHTIGYVQRWLDKLPKAVSRGAAAIANHTPYLAVPDLAERLSRHLDELSAMLDSAPLFRNADPTARTLPLWRFEHGMLPGPVVDIGENIYALADDLLGKVTALKSEIEEAHKDSEAPDALIAEVGWFVGRLESIVEVWGLMLANATGRQVPAAKWIALVKFGNNYDYTVNAGLISAAEKLSSMLWKKASAAILTSATLTAVGEFRMILRRTGLFWYPGVTTLKLDSPFDYQSNAKLVIPQLRSNPKDADAHTQEIVSLLPRLIEDNGTGTLVLFASRRQMEDVATSLPEPLRKKILIQGKLSKGEIIRKHCRLVDKKKTSIIFGLETFSEGVDLRGDYCTHVVIAKIPFAAPADPVEEATAEWLTKLGGNPFMDLVVPAASIKLVQSTGRLLRTESDTGTVTILDKRLHTQRYGQAILKALPPFRLEVQ